MMDTKKQLIELIESNSDNLVAIQCTDTKENTTFSVQEVPSLPYVSESQYDILNDLSVILKQGLIPCKVELVGNIFIVRLASSWFVSKSFYDTTVEVEGGKYFISHPDLGEHIPLNIEDQNTSHHLSFSLGELAKISAEYEKFKTNLFLAVFQGPNQEKQVLLLGFIPVLPLAITPLDKGGNKH
jgi:hypothetical protein